MCIYYCSSRKNHSRSRGFSLIELMIVLAIIMLLTTLALPSYQHIRDRAAFLEVVQATLPFKLAVAGCVITTGSLQACRSGQQGIPEVMQGSAHSRIKQIEVLSKGMIVATAQALHTNKHQHLTYRLTPTLESSGEITWTTSGTCVKAGLC